MKKSHLSTLTGSLMILISLPLLALLLLAGCRPEPVAQAEAAPSNDAESQAATVRINPADRKFYSGWYMPSTGVAGKVGVPASIHPADRKFITGVGSVSGQVESLVTVAPADRKFYDGAYAWRSAASGGAESLQSVAPADRKFYSAGDAGLESVHPADRKFFNR